MARKKGIRVACARFGVVLGKDGGALSKMIPAYRMFVGGPLGDGKHWFHWIQMDDLVNAGAIWENASVVIDRHFVSSRKPDDLPDFCRGIIAVVVAHKTASV